MGWISPPGKRHDNRPLREGVVINDGMPGQLDKAAARGNEQDRQV